jgi:hypothetical protein
VSHWRDPQQHVLAAPIGRRTQSVCRFRFPGYTKVGCVEIVFSSDPDQREQCIAARVSAAPMRCGEAVSPMRPFRGYPFSRRMCQHGVGRTSPAFPVDCGGLDDRNGMTARLLRAISRPDSDRTIADAADGADGVFISTVSIVCSPTGHLQGGASQVDSCRRKREMNASGLLCFRLGLHD